jgi:sodium-dependent dicarboxylate transporter 2/3/5
VLILSGGGLSIAAALSAAGEDRYLGTLLTGMAGAPLLALLLGLSALDTFNGELTSNTAAATTLMPILAALCAAAGIDPIPVFFTAPLTASLGFMLPLASPPNAIVYGTALIPLPAMIRAGFGMNVIGIVVVAWIRLATPHGAIRAWRGSMQAIAA